MRTEPQAAPYHPDPKILELAEWLGDAVAPADFPRHDLRFRNHRWDKTVGLAELSDDEWVRHFAHFEPLPDNLPLLESAAGLTRINGLFRHGWLIAPALVEQALSSLAP